MGHSGVEEATSDCRSGAVGWLCSDLSAGLCECLRYHSQPQLVQSWSLVLPAEVRDRSGKVLYDVVEDPDSVCPAAIPPPA